MRDIILKARWDKDICGKLVMDFEPVIKKWIRAFIRNPSYYYDALQEGYFSVLRCIKTYDVDSCYPFPAYVKKAVMYDIARFSKRIKEDVSLDEPINEDGGTLHDVLESDVDIEEDNIRKEKYGALYRAIDKLSKKQRDILIDVFFNEKSMREICKNRRCHYMSVVKLKERALKNLKEELEK